MSAIIPLPKEELCIRAGTMSDVPFIDLLQKRYSKNVGFLQLKALEGKIALGQVLIAESAGEMIGYIIAQDRYFKRDELGMICQLVVVPGKQRGFIGAALLKAQFDRSAYGCRLYCCWCAQDLEANRFWEAMGFVPLAFRAGSEKKRRVHIFWEKKIRGHDDPVNWWYPHKTDGGAMRANRLAFPIPPGTHWTEVKAVVLPDDEHPTDQKALSAPRTGSTDQKRKSAKSPEPLPELKRIFFAPAKPIAEKPTKRKSDPKPKKKANPKYVSASRELRDRYLEQVNENGFKLESSGKYELIRASTNAADSRITTAINTPAPLLAAA